jgi:hypothetical protein
MKRGLKAFCRTEKEILKYAWRAKMSDTDNKSWSRSDLIRYRAGEMTEKERNAFEKKMQRDPFLSDASEGLEGVTLNEAVADIEFISEKVQKKGRRFNALIYSGAAAAVILLIISSVWLFQTGRLSNPEPGIVAAEQTVKSDSTSLIALTPEPEKTGVPKESETFGESKTATPAMEAGKMTGSVKTEPVIEKRDEIILTHTFADRAEKKIVGKDTLITAREAISEAEKSSRLAGVSLQPIATVVPHISGTIYSKDDSLPLPGVALTVKGRPEIIAVSGVDGSFVIPVKPDSNILVVANFIGMVATEFRAGSEKPIRIEMMSDVTALDEIVVVGYGSERRTAVTGSVSTVRSSELSNTSMYRAAEPVCGYSEFNEYIKMNLRYPDDAKGASREVVVIDLPLSESGVKGVPVIVKSPGELFSAEAIRLVLAGPEWTPALMNGIPASDTIRVRIVFKK